MTGPTDTAPGRSRPAPERLARLLAIVPWVASHDGPSIAEVCVRFGVAEAELLADLDLLFLCGVHPFTPDTLIEVDVADGRVWIRFAPYFRRPLRLTPPEGLALVAAASALLAVPGADPDGALASALAKLEGVVGVAAGTALEVELGPVAADVLATVREAEAGDCPVRIDYWSFGRDDQASRVVHPWRVFSAAGQWYLRGWCELAGGERLFRVDRITAAEVQDGHFDRAEVPAGDAELFHPDPQAPLLVLDLAPEARWVAESYPNEGVDERGDGVLRVRLRVGQRAWAERLLVRAGAGAVVVEGDAGLAAGAAARMLERYSPGDPVT